MPNMSVLDFIRDGGAIVGDGSYLFTLERRGYILGGAYVPEAVLSHPDAVEQLSKEFAHCGAQMIQTFTFASTQDKLSKHEISAELSQEKLITRAVDIAKKAASPVNAFVCGGISSTTSFRNGSSAEVVKNELRKPLNIFVEKDVDLLLGEFFHHVEEALMAVEVMKEASQGSKPVAVTMVIGPRGDYNDVTPQECAVRLVKAGADIVGVNCGFDPEISLETISMMKDGLKEAGLDAVLMVQPCGYHCQEARNLKMGVVNLPDYPLALEPRILSRADCYSFARKAFDLGVRLIGGCCGFEPYHVRALALELQKETGHEFPGRRYVNKWGDAFPNFYAHRVGEKHWTEIVPGAGRQIRTYCQPDINVIQLT